MTLFISLLVRTAQRGFDIWLSLIVFYLHLLSLTFSFYNVDVCMDSLTILVSNAFIIFKMPFCFSLVLLLNQYKFKLTLFNEVNPLNCDERPEDKLLLYIYHPN